MSTTLPTPRASRNGLAPIDNPELKAWKESLAEPQSSQPGIFLAHLYRKHLP